jgi:parvulin-like peptidyl-prolyl isomerase
VGTKAAADIDYAQRVKAQAALELARRPNVSFPSLAQQQSEGERAKAGGDLGQVTEQSIDSLLWNELARMQPGEISGVIKAADGYHVLKLLRRNPEVRKSFEQASDEIKANIRLSRQSAKLAELTTRLRAKAKIENHFLRRYPQAAPRLRVGVLEGGMNAPYALPAILPPGPAPKASTSRTIP